MTETLIVVNFYVLMPLQPYLDEYHDTVNYSYLLARIIVTLLFYHLMLNTYIMSIH